MVQKIVARIGLSTDVPVLLTGEIGFDVDLFRFRVGDDTNAPPVIMTTKSKGPFSYPSIDYTEYPQIRMIGTGTVDGVDVSELNAASGFIVRRGDNSWGHRAFINTDNYLEVVNGDGISGNPQINAGPNLLSIAALIPSFLTEVTSDGTMAGLGTMVSPLSVVQATTTQRGALEVATDAEVIAGTSVVHALTPNNLQALTATTTRRGIVELATSAETIAGTDATIAVTPSSLSALTALTTRSGLVELATSAETIAGTDTSRAVTPASLAARTSTDTRTGLVELATNAEAIAGTDTTRALTPASLAASFTARTATDTRTGLVELATSAETIAGTDTSRAVTPASLVARTASATRTGLVELATTTETAAGTDATRAVTPASLVARTASATRTGLVELATAAETAAGTDATRAVTPASLVARTATDTRTGLVERATDAEAAAGTDTTRYVTPKQLKDNAGGVPATHTAVGSVMFCYGVAATPGTTITLGGATLLFPTDNNGHTSGGAYPLTSGTWRAHGYSLNSNSGTLWQRIS